MHVRACVQARGHAVVVVAEGAGEDEMCAEMSARGKVVERDAGGNRKLPPVGEWLQAKVAAHFDAAGTPASIRYIDPSYMIRSGEGGRGGGARVRLLYRPCLPCCQSPPTLRMRSTARSSPRAPCTAPWPA